MVLKVALKIILGFKNCRRSNSRHLTSSDTAYRILGVPFACLLNTKSCQDGYRRKLPNRLCVARRFDVACMSVCLSVACLRDGQLSVTRGFRCARAARQVFNFKLAHSTCVKISARAANIPCALHLLRDIVGTGGRL